MALPVTDPVLIVAIAMSVFLIMPMLTHRLRLPDIVGILLAGMILGPNMTGVLERDETISLLGTVGLLYLVFLAGLEVDLGDLNRKRSRAIVFGVTTFLLPQLVGTAMGFFLLRFPPASAILLGSVFASHSFLALLIAKRLGLIEREAVIAVIGGTVITDTLALLVLALVARTAQGDFDAWFLVRLFIQTAVFASIVVFLLPLVARWFFRKATDGSTHFAFMMTVLFVCGYGAHLAGLEPIIGAFLAGLAMNRLCPRNGVLANRTFFIGNTIFVPFFLFSVGMLIDIRMVVGDLRTIQVASLMTLTVFACKGAAAWLMRIFYAYPRDDVLVAWGLSLPQAATTLAVVLVGHRLMLFDDAVLNGTIVMVLATCIMGPVLVQSAGRRLAAAVSELPTATGDTPQRILIPIANPKSNPYLLDLAIALRHPLSNEPLLPLSVAARQEGVEHSERLLGNCVAQVAGADVPVSPVVRVDVNPISGILRASSEKRISTLVMGWSGPQSIWQRHFHLTRGLIDSLVDQSTSQLLVARITHPLPIVERVVLLVPERAVNEWGFIDIINDCKLLVKRLGATLLVGGDGALPQRVQDLITKTGVTCPTSFDASIAGPDLAKTIAAMTGTHDLVLIISARENTISWNVRWARLPAILANSQPLASMVVAYPRLMAAPHARAANGSEGNEQDILSGSDFVLGVQAHDLRALLDAALARFKADTAATTDLRAHLDDLIERTSMLDDRVALTHAHVAGLDRPRLLVATTCQPLPITGGALRILFILLNLPSIGPEQHLANLATVARAIRFRPLIDALLAADNVAQARSALQSPHTAPDGDDSTAARPPG